jgi:hypothetical protein
MDQRPEWPRQQQHRVRRRRRRRSRRAVREAGAWLTLFIAMARKIYHWSMLIALIAFILAVGFAFPMFA